MKDLLTNMFKAKDKADQELREAQEEMMDAHRYIVSVGSGGSAGNYVWHGNGNNINPTWTALDEVRDNIKQLDYILQRIVPNYDELVAQYRAIKDIEEAGK